MAKEEQPKTNYERLTELDKGNYVVKFRSKNNRNDKFSININVDRSSENVKILAGWRYTPFANLSEDFANKYDIITIQSR